MESRRVYIKHPSEPPVCLTAGHFRPDVAAIISAVHDQWPAGVPIVITRGAEQVPGGKASSKHLTSRAFDFRTRHLAGGVSRQTLLDRIMARLGPGYYGYFGQTERAEWIHIQCNKEI